MLRYNTGAWIIEGQLALVKINNVFTVLMVFPFY